MVSKTGIGIGNGIPFGNNSSGGDRPYLSPELKSRLRIIAHTFGKRNEDADRATIRNLVDPDNPLLIKNAAFKLNSGFGKYEVDFLDYSIVPNVVSITRTSNKLSVTNNDKIGQMILYRNIADSSKPNTPAFKIKISNLTDSIRYYYIDESDTTKRSSINITSDGVYDLPESKNTLFNGTTSVNIGFGIDSGGSVTIEQIPSLEDSFISDGVNDIIESTKTFAETFGEDCKEFTIVSMIRLIGTSAASSNSGYTNYFRSGNNYTRNNVTNADKTGIYGYYANLNNQTFTIVDYVLGDKNDYKVNVYTPDGSIANAKFTPIGYIGSDGTLNELRLSAYTFTIGAIGKLTEDDINQIIGYYNLDRTVKADIYCNITKQGITNENHAEFNDKLIDYSGNGRDIQMYNLAWKGGSGIGAKEYETIKDFTKIDDNEYQEVIVHNEFSYTTKSKLFDRYWSIQAISRANETKEITIIANKNCEWICTCPLFNSEGIKENALIKKQQVIANIPTKVPISGIEYFEIPEGYTAYSCASYASLPYSNGELTIEIIPSCKGSIILDGINDFGKAIGLPVYKDYTVAIEYERFNIGYIEGVGTATAISKSYLANQGAFLMNLISSNGRAIHSYSFGEVTINDFNDLTREIYYQSKYNNQGLNIAAGTGDDSDSLWLGIVRDNDSRFFNGAIYFLMVFPYSMSKFLIDRQLKKYKAGTLYKDMVQFRPVVKQDDRIKSINYYIESKTAVIGQYYSIGSGLGIGIEPVPPYRVASLKVNGKTTVPNVDYKGFNTRLNSKTPQKITMDIEVDESLIQFNPIIESNVDYTVIQFYINNYTTRIQSGDYIPINTPIQINFYLKNNVDELISFKVNGSDSTFKRSTVVDNAYNVVTVPITESPQKIEITIDEYIRYEDIVQPYPEIWNITQNAKKVSWGDKLKVGSEFGYNSKVNLLSGLYSTANSYYNGKVVKTGDVLKVEKQMVFACNYSWIGGSNEPKCILSPSRLRIPNSSYKILGYIPDISGHGNHGVIHNSAYALNSGANGYPYDYKSNSFVAHSSSAILIDSETVKFINVLTQTTFYEKGKSYKGKIKVTGITDAIASGKVRYLDIYSNSETNDDRIIINKDGTYDVNIETEDAVNIFFYLTPIVSGTTVLDKPVYIEQVGEYEGAFCLDGINDFVEIPTTVGGKQVLLKCVWDSNCYGKLLYDQRTLENFGSAILVVGDTDTSSNSKIAYYARNVNGKTYIDGILNEYIHCNSLIDKVHNITITDSTSYNRPPTIGTSNRSTHDFFSSVKFYDLMLFDEIDSDEEIINLNKYVGIEPKIEIPNWYYDVHGKTNEDTYKTQITEQVGYQRNGTSGDYIMNNYNIAYEGMSGYNGYPVVFGLAKTWTNAIIGSNYVANFTNTIINITKVNQSLTGVLYSYVKQNDTLVNIKEIPSFKVSIKGLEGKSKVGYKYLATDSATSSTIIYLENGTHELPKSFTPTEALLDLDYNEWIGFFISSISDGTTAFDCDITIEVLPEYPNGLAYDGVTDYSTAIRIPVFTDYTYILKRRLLANIVSSASMFKGTTYINGGWAFITDYYNSNGKTTGYSFGNAAAYDINENDLFVYGTKTSVNGNSITPGSSVDEIGITIGRRVDKYKQMVFYKLVLYNKTIPKLWIDFLRNLMAREEIINITYPVFIQGTGGEPEKEGTLIDLSTHSVEPSGDYSVTSDTLKIYDCSKNTDVFNSDFTDTDAFKITVTGIGESVVDFVVAGVHITKDGVYNIPKSESTNFTSLLAYSDRAPVTFKLSLK